MNGKLKELLDALPDTKEINGKIVYRPKIHGRTISPICVCDAKTPIDEIVKKYNYFKSLTEKPVELLNIYEGIILNKKPLKKKSGIYFLLQDDYIVYVGQTQNIYARLIDHSFNKEMIFTHYHFIEAEKNCICELERQFISKIQPQYNKMLRTAVPSYR